MHYVTFFVIMEFDDVTMPHIAPTHLPDGKVSLTHFVRSVQFSWRKSSRAVRVVQRMCSSACVKKALNVKPSG